MTTNSQELTIILRKFYKTHGRELPWRQPGFNGRFDPYRILVSEVMLQQTQVSRVIPKYQEFVQLFPDIASLADASLPEVLAVWSGLGYNRRARYLWEAAKNLQNAPQPWSQEILVAQRGIGTNTAAAVLAYTYDAPVLFVETNIRTVLLHLIFPDNEDVSDKILLEALDAIVPWRHGQDDSPRIFYWSMMDYGTYLKTTVGNQNHRSRSYTKQSPFEGSKRQLRGKLMRQLLSGPLETKQASELLPDPRLPDVINDMVQDGLLIVRGKTLMLYNEDNEK